MKLFYELDSKLVFAAESKDQLLNWMKNGNCLLTDVEETDLVELEIIKDQLKVVIDEKIKSVN